MFECADVHKVHDHKEQLIDNHLLDSYVTQEEQSGGPTGDYMARCGAAIIRKD